jgi:hypothetical protein
MRREWEAMKKMSGDGSNEQGRGSGGVTGTPCEDGIVIAWDLGKEDSSVVHAWQHQKEAA